MKFRTNNFNTKEIMKTNNIFFALFLGLAMLMSSCGSDETTLFVDSSGNLILKIVGDGDAPIANQKVRLQDEDGDLLDVQFTDEEGKIDFGKFNGGTLYVEIERKLADYKYITLYEEVQVLTSNTNEHVIPITSERYTGEVEVTTRDESGSEPVSGVKVYAFQYNDDTNDIDVTGDDWVDDVKPAAPIMVVSDENGIAKFDLPIGHRYYFIVENSTGDDRYDWNGWYWINASSHQELVFVTDKTLP